MTQVCRLSLSLPSLSRPLSVGNIVSILNDVGMLFVSGVFKHASWKALRSGLTGTATVTVQAPKPAAGGFIFNSKAYDEESTLAGDSSGAEGTAPLASAPYRVGMQ